MDTGQADTCADDERDPGGTADRRAAPRRDVRFLKSTLLRGVARVVSGRARAFRGGLARRATLPGARRARNQYRHHDVTRPGVGAL